MDLKYNLEPLNKELKWDLEDIKSWFKSTDYPDCAFWQYSKSRKNNPFKPDVVWISCNCKRCAVMC